MIIFIVDEGGDDSAETLGAMSGGDRLYDARGLEGGLELGVRIRVHIRVRMGGGLETPYIQLPLDDIIDDLYSSSRA